MKIQEDRSLALYLVLLIFIALFLFLYIVYFFLTLWLSLELLREIAPKFLERNAEIEKIINDLAKINAK